MKRILKFWHLSSADQWLLLESALLLGLITLGLRILPFLTLQRLLHRASQTFVRLPHNNQPTAKQIAWAVQVAAQYIPSAACLPQALTVQLLYRRQGYPANLRIGVAKNQQGRLEAHAWVESQDRVVIGKLHDLSRYTLLPSWESYGK